MVLVRGPSNDQSNYDCEDYRRRGHEIGDAGRKAHAEDNHRREVREGVGWHDGRHEHQCESPEFEVAEVVQKFLPGEWIGLCVATVDIEAMFDGVGFFCGEEALPFGFVGEVDDDKPCTGGDYDCEKSLNNLFKSLLARSTRRVSSGTYEDPLPATDSTYAFHLDETVRQD